MSDFTLTAEPFLGGYSGHFDGAELVEVTDRALVSIAVPLGGREALANALGKAYGAEIPAAGKTTRSTDGEALFLGLGSDQFFALLPRGTGLAVTGVADKLDAAGYYTEQSDNWAMLRLSGPRALAALERICPLDLHADAFHVGDVARTAMEHLGVIILREGANAFLLMSASSSAHAFLDAVTVSIHNVT